LKASSIETLLVGDREQAVVRDDDEGVDLVDCRASMPDSA
jgi:hypothetical protein